MSTVMDIVMFLLFWVGCGFAVAMCGHLIRLAQGKPRPENANQSIGILIFLGPLSLVLAAVALAAWLLGFDFQEKDE